MASIIERTRGWIGGWFAPQPPTDPCAAGHAPGEETDQSFPLEGGGYMKWRICVTCGRRVKLDVVAGKWV